MLYHSAKIHCPTFLYEIYCSYPTETGAQRHKCTSLYKCRWLCGEASSLTGSALSHSPLFCFTGAVGAACRGLGKVNHAAIWAHSTGTGEVTPTSSHIVPLLTLIHVLQRSLDESTLCKRPQRNPLTKVTGTYRLPWIRETTQLWGKFPFKISNRKLLDLIRYWI